MIPLVSPPYFIAGVTMRFPGECQLSPHHRHRTTTNTTSYITGSQVIGTTTDRLFLNFIFRFSGSQVLFGFGRFFAVSVRCLVHPIKIILADARERRGDLTSGSANWGQIVS